MTKLALDPVAGRLSETEDCPSTEVLEWLESQQRRRAMDRRATSCSVSAFAMITFAAIVGSIVALVLSNEVKTLFAGDLQLESGVPLSVTILPIVLASISGVMLIGGTAAWTFDRIPGLRSTRSAIDWSAIGDAMHRLLSIGCTYPEAFRTVAAITRTRAGRDWLQRAAARVERGDVTGSSPGTAPGDAAIVELMVAADQQEPARQWRIAGDHFTAVAQRRLSLLIGSVPVLATLISGVLVWASISSSLGWLWRAVSELCGMMQ